MTDPATIAASLSEEQRLAMIEDCSCGIAHEMVDLGLWAPEFDFPSAYYTTTPLGIAVRKHLQENSRG